MSALTHKGLVQILRASEGPTPRLCRVAADRIDEYIALIAEHDAMLAEREATCAWTEDPDGFWATDCGESFAIHEGSPGQNGLRFCCFCGRRLAEGAA